MTFPNDWDWKADISSESSQVESSETDFPYLFKLDNINDSDFWNNVQSDGGDLRVSTDEDGENQVPLQVVFIDDQSEEGEIYFRGDTDDLSDKTFYIWWKNDGSSESQPNPGDATGSENVWQSDYDFVGHGQDSTTVVDSTGSLQDFIENGNPEHIDALHGKGWQYDANGDRHNSNESGFTNTSSKTITFAYQSNGTNFDASRGVIFGLERDDNDERYIFLVTEEDDTGNYNLWAKHTDGQVDTDSGETPTTTGYDIVQARFDNGEASLFVNGTEVVTETGLGNEIVNENATINVGGDKFSEDRSCEGQLDAFRVSDAALSSGWLETERNMLSDNSSFWSVGTVDSTLASVQTDPATNVDFESAQLNGEVTDLGEETEVFAGFEWGESGAGLPNDTGTQQIGSPQTFDELIDNLDDDTEYEFKAYIEDDQGERLNEGSTLTFTTDVKQTGSVATDPASNVGSNSAQLNGELTDLGDFDEADAFFRYRETGATEWTETTVQTLTEPQTFDETVSGLDPETEYEFKAVADFDGEEETGTVNTFTTLEESPDAEIVNRTSPLEGSEYQSDIIDHIFDVEINEDGDYTVTIFVDTEQKFAEDINGAVAGETYSYNEQIDTGEFGSKTTDIEVKKQSDGS